MIGIMAAALALHFTWLPQLSVFVNREIQHTEYSIPAVQYDSDSDSTPKALKVESRKLPRAICMIWCGKGMAWDGMAWLWYHLNQQPYVTWWYGRGDDGGADSDAATQRTCYLPNTRQRHGT